MKIVYSFLLLGVFSCMSVAQAASLSPQMTWHVQLQGTLVDTQKQLLDIDLYDTPQASIAQLAKTSTVICYFSAGSYENWRSDASKFLSGSLGKPMSGWAGENWIDVRTQNVRDIMKARLDLAVVKGCHGVDPDNVNVHENDTGFNFTIQDAQQYNTFLIQEAKKRNLFIGLKNAQSLLPTLGSSYDFFINESCYTYSECTTYSTVRALNKPVFIIEYTKNTNWCTQAQASGFNLSFYPKLLNGAGTPCMVNSTSTPSSTGAIVPPTKPVPVIGVKEKQEKKVEKKNEKKQDNRR